MAALKIPTGNMPPSMFTITALLLMAWLHVSKAGIAEQPNEPYKLTGWHAEENPTLWVKVQDQCMLQPGQLVIAHYILRFFKQPGFICDDAKENSLLICYESLLNVENTKQGFYIKREFQLEHDPTNNVTQRCEEKRKLEMPNGQTPAWNGILLYNDGNGKTIMQTSLTKTEQFIFDGQQFDIVLISDQKHTEIVDNSDEPRSPLDHEKNLTESDRFFQNYRKIFAYKGALMKKYVHLWALGLDMLPYFEASDPFELRVYRACGCSMDVYLMSPADETIPPTSNPLSFGSNKCEKREIVGQIVDLPAGCGIDKAIQLRGLTDSNEPVQIEISLLDEQNVTIMKATINESATEMTTKKGDIASSTINSSIGAVKTDAVFYLSLVLTPYNYVLTVRMGSSDVVQLEHWPQQWWQSGIEQIKKMELNGRFILVQKPECSDGGRGEILPQIPWYKKFEEMKVNGRILIKAIPNENAQYFDIILLHDAPEWHIYIGATVMRLRVNFTNDGKSDISLGTYLHRNWLNKTDYNDFNATDGNTFQQNVAFELQMDILDKHIEISRNGEPPIIRYMHRMPIWSINWLRVDGDIRLLKEPNIAVPNVTKRGETSMELASLLRPGDVIRMQGDIPPNAASFSIYLLHEAAEPEAEGPFTIGDSILRLHFSFGTNFCVNATNKCTLTVTYYDFQKNRWEGEKSTSNSNLVRNHYFNLQIDVGEKDFDIINYQESIIKYQEGYLPSWAVDHIWITGDVNINCGPVIIGPSVLKLPKDQCGPKQIESSQPDNRILQVHEPLVVGDVIKIKGNLSDSDGDHQSTISLFSEALGSDLTIGKTVLAILANPEVMKIAFWAYYGGQAYNVNKSDVPDLQLKAKLGIQIVVAKHYYDITLSHDDKAIFNHQFRHVLPIWAVEYIVVGQHFAIDGQIELDRAQKIDAGPLT